jgi:hypothetical protein
MWTFPAILWAVVYNNRAKACIGIHTFLGGVHPGISISTEDILHGLRRPPSKVPLQLAICRRDLLKRMKI